MLHALNITHDPTLRSWVEAANAPSSDFPIQNLPFGVFKRIGSGEPGRVGVAIGDQILDVAACLRAGLLEGLSAAAARACGGPTLNDLMARGSEHWSALRAQLSALLRTGAPAEEMSEQLLLPIAAAEMLPPAQIGDYTDFYASIHHATTIGSFFRPDNPLLPNYKYVPIGYHGRASSIVTSGTPIRRPNGQTRDTPDAQPNFGPATRLDYELEVGCFVGPGNPLGQPIAIEAAETHMFGLCLVNDWSARDIQTWEYQPLGPFLSKSFATSISPWIVTLEALAPYRTSATPRPAEDPAPLPYLASDDDQARGAFALTLEVALASRQMREAGLPPTRVSRASFADMYWTFAQLLTHHASNGCNMRPGDLLASGTVSGQAKDARGCLIELTARGAEPIALQSGEQRSFLEDGDEVIVSGWCEREGFRRIGFGECRGIVLPATGRL
jgi:fumarylacetoacetase